MPSGSELHPMVLGASASELTTDEAASHRALNPSAFAAPGTIKNAPGGPYQQYLNRHVQSQPALTPSNRQSSSNLLTTKGTNPPPMMAMPADTLSSSKHAALPHNIINQSDETPYDIGAPQSNSSKFNMRHMLQPSAQNPAASHGTGAGYSSPTYYQMSSEPTQI